jgi:hypothetical protein
MGAADMPNTNTHAETIIFGIIHLTAIVTAGLVCPATLSTTGTASPVVIPLGTIAFTWYNPAYPGVSPLNATCAVFPPIVTVTGFTVVDCGGVVGAGDPSFTAGATAPSPVQ